MLMTPPLFYPNFGDVSVAPEQIAHVGVDVSRNLKLFNCEVIFEVFQPV